LQDIAAAASQSVDPNSSAGSAIYITASLLNHSCDPNVIVSFPRGNATAVFSAARDVAAGEQLTISYMDSEQPVANRQEYLAFAYGFSCRCPRCIEELQEQQQ
jgi:SET domain-containing protein